MRVGRFSFLTIRGRPRSIAQSEAPLTSINIMFISRFVIQTFADSETKRFYTAGNPAVCRRRFESARPCGFFS